MRRVRIVLALMLVALALPVSLIVTRALRSIEFERRGFHEAVAKRTFDEMERSLSEFLSREEARAPAAYAFYTRLEPEPGDAEGLGRRSELSHPPSEPFVVAYFQIDPDGELVTPLRPRDVERGVALGDWPPPVAERDRVFEAIALLESKVAPFWRQALARADDEALDRRMLEELAAPQWRPSYDEARPATGPASEQATSPARARAKAEPSPLEAALGAALDAEGTAGAEAASEEARPLGELAEAEDDAEKKVTAYDAISSLNVGVRQRLGRKDVVTQEPRSLGFAKQQRAAPERVAPASQADALPGSGASPYASSEDADAVTDVPRRGGRPSAAMEPMAPAVAPAVPEPGAEQELVHVIRRPMSGASLDDDHWMLYRTVLVDGEGYYQGVVLNRGALGGALARRVVGAGRLAEATRLDFGDAPPAAPSGWFQYDHRFAEPFEGLRARLALQPLAGMGSAVPIYLLAALLAGVALVGVLAVHRMVAVVVHFAERRSSFVSAVSHELKTPLTSIRMYAEMLRDGLVSEPDKRDEYYHTIHDESERLSRLIDNVLEFSRLEKGSRVFDLRAGDVGTVVGEIAERLRPHATREGFRLRVDVDEGLPPVRFDRDALVQIVFNLVDNAIKYAAASEQKEIVLRCAAGESGGVVVSVRDFGPGVAREQLAQVFEPFYRAEPELTRATRGSGIGLALVKELGEAMGAAVSGANAEGGGFRVDLAFPRPAAGTA